MSDIERFLGMPKSVFWSIFGTLVVAGVLGGLNMHTQQAVANTTIVEMKEDMGEMKGDISTIQEAQAEQALETKELSTNMGHVMDEQKEQGDKLDAILEKLTP